MFALLSTFSFKSPQNSSSSFEHSLAFLTQSSFKTRSGLSAMSHKPHTNFCLRVSVAVIKHQKQLGEGKWLFQFIVPYHSPLQRKSGQKLKQKLWRNTSYWLAPSWITQGFFLSCFIFIIMYLRTTYLEMTPPRMHWALPQ